MMLIIPILSGSLLTCMGGKYNQFFGIGRSNQFYLKKGGDKNILTLFAISVTINP